MQPGDPLDPATEMGAIVDETQTQDACWATSTPGRRKARRLRRRRPAGRARTSGGFYVEPTVFDGVDTEMRIAREEIFGPVLSVIPRSRTPSEAVAHRQRRRSTGSPRRCGRATSTRRIASRARCAPARCCVNCYDADDITVPFGGYKQSGIGRDKSLHAFDKYTELKTTWIDLST